MLFGANAFKISEIQEDETETALTGRSECNNVTLGRKSLDGVFAKHRLSFLFASYNGALIVFLTEIMPADVRTAGFSLVHSSATAIFGGFTPAISTYLIHATGNRAIPGLWLSFAAVCGLIATALLSSSRVAWCSVMHEHAP
jgi:hypothetical protein